MKTITLHIDGMTCSHCVGAVKRALSAVPGVASADVSLEDKKAVVQLGNDSVDTQALIKAVQDEGYKASV